MFGSGKSGVYEAEVDIETAEGRWEKYRGQGFGRTGLGPDEVLDSAEAAALKEAGPGARVKGSRMRPRG